MATISDINAEARLLCDADTTSYPAAALLRRINDAYERVVGWILDSDGTWQFDDTNYTAFPRGYKNLVANQYDYSFDEEMLQIEEVHVKDNSGDYYMLRPIDPRDYDEPLTQIFDTAGKPIYYDKDGGSIILYPAPASGDVTLTNGLRVHYRRTADIFTSAQVTAGTKEPGFASPWHYILSYMAAIPYCQAYKKDRVQEYKETVEKMKNELIAHYSRRETDKVEGFHPGGVRFM